MQISAASRGGPGRRPAGAGLSASRVQHVRRRSEQLSDKIYMEGVAARGCVNPPSPPHPPRLGGSLGSRAGWSWPSLAWLRADWCRPPSSPRPGLAGPGPRGLQAAGYAVGLAPPRPQQPAARRGATGSANLASSLPSRPAAPPPPTPGCCCRCVPLPLAMHHLAWLPELVCGCAPGSAKGLT